MMIKIIKLFWGGMCGALLFVSLFFYFFNGNKDYGTVMIWGMLVLSFPGGLINIYILGNIFIFFLRFFPIEFSYPAQIFFLWIGFVFIGYLQWFNLFPYLLSKFKKIE